MLITSAFAGDVAIKGNVTETLQGSDNYFLSQNPSGPTGETLTSGTLNVLARTPTTNYALDANASYFKYFGPGAADTSLTWGTPANARFSINHIEKLTAYNFAASWARSDAAQTSLAQTGFATGRGSINTYAVDGGLTHDLSRADSITWTAHATSVSYTDPNQFPFVDVVTTAAWQHSVSSTTTLNNFVSFDWFSQDNPEQSQRLFWKLMSGINSRITPRLTFAGHVGIGFVNSYQTNPAQVTIPSAAFVPQVGAANSILADVSFTYRLLKMTTVSLIAAQAVVPTSFGQLQKNETVGLTLTHAINHLSNVSFSANFSHVPAAPSGSLFSGQSSSSNFLSAAAVYSYQLTRDWRTNLSYTYRQRDDNSGTARSSTVLFSLSRDLNLLGNPTAINDAAIARARARAQQSVGYVFPGFQ